MLKSTTLPKGRAHRRAPAKARPATRLRQAVISQPRPGSHTKARNPCPRPDSKTGKILALLRRPQGASLGELTRVTNWLENSIRGILSGTVRKKLVLKVVSTKPDKIRRYRIVEASVAAP